MTPAEVIDTLRSGEMTYNCSLVLISFLMRHGIITAENEPDYLELLWICHQPLSVAVPALNPNKGVKAVTSCL